MYNVSLAKKPWCLGNGAKCIELTLLTPTLMLTTTSLESDSMSLLLGVLSFAGLHTSPGTD